MSRRSGCEQRSSQRSAEGAGGAMTERALTLHDNSFAITDLLRKRRQEIELETKLKERQQRLAILEQNTDELQWEFKKVKELHKTYDKFLKDKVVYPAAEEESEDLLQLEANKERLEVEYVEVMGRKQELQRQVQRHSLYQDYMERIVKMTKFNSVKELIGHLENCVHFRDHLYQKYIEVQEQIDQQKKTLQTLEDQHHFIRLQKNSQLYQLQGELEKTHSEALILEREWNHFLERAAKKTITLGRIKMATLNLYEMTDDKIEGREAVDMNDTEKQLDKIKEYIKDQEDLVKQYQVISQRCNAQEKGKPKNAPNTA
ncbi:hypothetical protein ABVT39_023349 [Epinephelus coioides]